MYRLAVLVIVLLVMGGCAADPAQKLLADGRSYFEDHDYQRAAASLSKVLAAREGRDYPEAQYLLGQCLEALGQYDGAIRQYEACVAWYPGSDLSARATGRLLNLYIATRHLNKADKLLEEIWMAGAGDEMDFVLFQWMVVAYRLGDVERAYAICQELIEQFPASSYAQKAQILREPLRLHLRHPESYPV